MLLTKYCFYTNRDAIKLKNDTISIPSNEAVFHGLIRMLYEKSSLLNVSRGNYAP